jgi:hypothetical protein
MKLALECYLLHIPLLKFFTHLKIILMRMFVLENMARHRSVMFKIVLLAQGVPGVIHGLEGFHNFSNPGKLV